MRLDGSVRFLALALAAAVVFGCQPPAGNGGGAGGNGGGNGGAEPQPVETVMWINHLDMLAGDPSVVVSFNAVSSGLGLSGLIIESTALGDTAPTGGNKVVQKAALVPPGYLVTGVRTCYQLSNARSFITQVRLAQVQDPPAQAMVRLDDATDLVDPGPVCVDSSPVVIDPEQGALLLSLRVNFGDLADRIVLRALGLHLRSKP